MNSVFVDTFYYIAVTNPLDNYHSKAIAWGKQFQGKLITTEYILLEFGNFMTRGRNRVVFNGLIRQLRSDPLTIIIPASTNLFDSGLELYAAHPDKEWSLTDCLSFVVMNQYGISEVLTGDHHFEQAGFKILL